MVVAIDVILLLLGLIIIIRHTAIGFVRSFFSFFKLGACIISAFLLTPMLFPYLSGKVPSMLGYLLVFIGVYALLTLLSYIIDRICRLPFLNAANKFGGFLVGVLCAYIVISAAAALVTVISILTEDAIFGMNQAALSNNTVIYGFLDKYGAFEVVKYFLY